MAGFVSIGSKMKRDLEILSLAKAAGLDDQTLAAIDAAVQQATAPAVTNPTPSPQSGIDNWLRDADFDHSVNSYTGSGAADEAYGWFRGLSSGAPVKSAATNPLWDSEQGWLEWLTTTDSDDLSYNFPTRLVRPGQSLFLMFNARMKDGASGVGLSMECGFWDKTVGIDNWISASLSGASGSPDIVVTKAGPGAAAITYTYVVVAITDRNETIVSSSKSVSGAAALNSTNYNQIFWTISGGILEYRIFRISPNPGLIGIVKAGSSFNDQGALLIAGAPIPSPPLVQAKTTLQDLGNRLSGSWQTIQTTIRIPRSYNMSLTGSDKQWLRLGLRGSCPNPIQFDRIGVSLIPGLWQPAPEDRQAVNDTVIAPTGDGEQLYPVFRIRGFGGVEVVGEQPGGPSFV